MSVQTQETAKSPFHAGEQELQRRTGKREQMEAFGQKAIQSFMPDQHREFYQNLPFIVAGAVDDKGWPWASIVSGNPGFLETPDDVTLVVNGAAPTDDPLAAAVKAGAPIGFLGMDPSNRRRNRLNGRIAASASDGFVVAIDQAFGNCPQYIQTRAVEFHRDPAAPRPGAHEAMTDLSDADRALISEADTFFVSSYITAADRPEIEGVDVSHRGGRPGFVKVEGNTLTIPDYPGNYHFNTFGNFMTNPKAGLVFADFETGDVLTLTGTVELLWDIEDPEIAAFRGAERAWKFTVDHGVRLPNALPFLATFQEYSPNSLLAGDWKEARETVEAEAERNEWRDYRVVKTERESSVITSFYFERADGGIHLPFKPGQFLTIRVSPESADKPVVRTYTVSSAPNDPHYRISVKREADGVVSRHLHDTLVVGDVVEAKAPKGAFFMDTTEKRPAVLLAGGVGITPMVSLARQAVSEGVRARHTRPMTIIHATQDTAQRAFADDFRAMEQSTAGKVRYVSIIGDAKADEAIGVDYDGIGRIDNDVLRQALAFDDYEFFLCGPPPFMQSVYDSLRDLGARDARIFAEAFGPASLKRRPDEGAPAPAPVEEAEQATIKFARSGFEQRWEKGDAPILDTAENHGLTPEFSCRSGSCGSCAVKLTKGEIAYRTQPTADRAEDEILICCAVPAKGSDEIEIDL